jgi:HK97 family phage major capsid protein
MNKRDIKPDVLIRRRLNVEDIDIKTIDSETRTIWHTISREVEDRMGDIVRIGGGDFTDFEKKPAVLYGHDYRSMNPIPVIGRNVGFKVEGDRLYAGTQFLPVNTPGMSQGMRDLINDNWLLHEKNLLGWSIGFMAKKWDAMMENGSFLGYDIKEWALLEYSSVIIPANQDAVNDAIKGGRITGAVVKYFDLGSGQASTDPAASKASQQAGEEPEVIETEPAKEPAADPKTQQTTGGTMLEKIIEKLSKGEELTPEEKEFWTKYQAAMGPKPAAAPNRTLQLVDTTPRGDVRMIKRFYGASPDDDNQKWLADDPKTYTPAEKELVGFLDDAYIVSAITKRNPRHLKMWDSFFGRSSALKKAMDTATATEGAEWIPTLLSENFIEKFRLEAKVAALFDDIPMPRNPFKLPYVGGMSAANFYLVPESISDSPTASPASTMATGDQTLTAKKLKARTLWSDEFDEDSILAVLPILKKELAIGGAEAIEDCIINGDTTATHQDSDVTESTDRRKIWNGLRDQCPSGTKVDLGTFATATLLSILTKMGKYAVNPKELAFITGARGYNYLRNLTETLTVDKYGAQATILNGELGKLAGIPIIISESIRENLNATGVYDGSTTDNTVILVVNRRALMLGTRGAVKLTFVSEGQVDQNQLIMSFRKALAYRWTASSTVTTIGLAYNVAV